MPQGSSIYSCRYAARPVQQYHNGGQSDKDAPPPTPVQHTHPPPPRPSSFPARCTRHLPCILHASYHVTILLWYHPSSLPPVLVTTLPRYHPSSLPPFLVAAHPYYRSYLLPPFLVTARVPVTRACNYDVCAACVGALFLRQRPNLKDNEQRPYFKGSAQHALPWQQQVRRRSQPYTTRTQS